MGQQISSAQDEPAPRSERRWDPQRACWIEARVNWRGDDGRYVRQTDRMFGAQLTFPEFERGAA
jgi:hypothetical protein